MTAPARLKGRLSRRVDDKESRSEFTQISLATSSYSRSVQALTTPSLTKGSSRTNSSAASRDPKTAIEPSACGSPNVPTSRRVSAVAELLEPSQVPRINRWRLGHDILGRFVEHHVPLHQLSFMIRPHSIVARKCAQPLDRATATGVNRIRRSTARSPLRQATGRPEKVASPIGFLMAFVAR
jgi:hypothetical protein